MGSGLTLRVNGAIDVYTYTHLHTQMGGKRERERKTDRQTDRQTDKQTDRLPSITFPATFGIIPLLGSKGTSLSTGRVLYPILRRTWGYVYYYQTCAKGVQFNEPCHTLYPHSLQ